MMEQGQVQPDAESVSTPNDAPEYSSDSYGSPQGGLLGRLLALRDERARAAVDDYGNYDPDTGSAALTYAAPPQELPDTPQKPVRVPCRRLYR